MINNKKAVSAVVATVLIILITIAAVTIIWAAIIPMIQNQLSGSGDCLDASGHMSLNEALTCYRLTWHNESNPLDYGYEINATENRWTINGTELSIGVKRLQGSFDVTGIMVKAFVGGNTISEKVIKSVGSNTEYLIKVASPDYLGVQKITYAPLIKPAGGTAEKECSAVSETVATLCA
jgi:hypothetical protein